MADKNKVSWALALCGTIALVDYLIRYFGNNNNEVDILMYAILFLIMSFILDE